MLLAYFLGPPLFASLIASAVLHIPFQPIRARSGKFKFWVWLRIGLAITALIGVLVFKLLGGYEDFRSSEFSPIGTDERGLSMIRFTAGITFFVVVTVCELNYVFVKRQDSR